MFRRTQVCSAIALGFAGGALLGGNALAQQQLDRVEVTGSSIKRIEAAEALPVTTISRKDIERTGATSTEQLLASVTATSFVGSYNSAEGAGTSTYGLASVSLRGLGSQRTLVLVNGRRLANFASDGTSVDINSIPLSAIDRVEVLRDGASSVYGSDAVAGVINFILRQDYKGVEISAYAGSPTQKGGGQVYKAGLVGGFGDLASDRYNVVLSLDLAKERALYGRDRKFSNFSWTEDGLYTQSATPSGVIKGPWVIGKSVNDQPTLDTIGNPLDPNDCAKSGAGFDPAFGTCRYNAAPQVNNISDTRRINLSGSLNVQLSDSTKVFAEAFYTQNKILTIQQPAPISASFLATDQAFKGSGVEQSLLLFPGNPNYPLAFLTAVNAQRAADALADPANALPPLSLTAPYSVSLRSFDTGPRTHTDDNRQGHLAAGVDGTAGTWDYNVAASYNSSRVYEYTQDGYPSQLALVSYLNSQPTWDPYAINQSPAIAAGMRATNYNGPMLTSTLSSSGIDAKTSTTFGKLGGGPIGVALGGSFKREKMDYQPSAAYQSGDISGYGGQQLPLVAQRNATGLFGEAEFPFLKSLTLNGSLRTDHYPGQTSTNPKLSLRWQPTGEFLFRGSIGTGFREASLPELYLPQVIATSSTFKDPVTNVTGQFTTRTGGNPDLKPEKSRQASVGVLFEPTREVSAGFDLFKVHLDETIQNGGLAPAFIVQQAAAGNPAYVGLVKRDGANNITEISALNINAGATDVVGLDVDLKGRLARLDYGDVNVSLNGTYMIKYDVTLPDGTVQHSVAATTDPNGNLLAIQNNSGGGIVMRWRHNLTFALTNDVWSLALTENYQTGYWDNTDANGQDSKTGLPVDPIRRVSSFETWDLQGTFNASKSLKLTAGVKNMFDTSPPFAYTNGNYFQVGWDPTYYDPRGRFVYVSLAYKF